ncbi:undecaprenyl pyrophosphate phosphatase [compost metagenome]
MLGVLAGRGTPARIRLAWLLLASLPAAAIAVSRVYLGVHWPTDVVAGALLAGNLCALALLLAQWHTPLPPAGRQRGWLLLPLVLLVLASLLGAGTELYRY